MKKSLLFVTVAALGWACGNDAESGKAGSFELKGTLSNAAGNEMLYLEELAPSGKRVLDSTQVDAKGNFAFTHSSPTPGFYRVKVNEANFAMLVLDSTQKVTLTADIKDMGNTYKAEGSADTKIFLDMNELGKDIQMRTDSLQRAFQASMGVIQMDSTKVDSLNRVFEPIYMRMVEEHQRRISEVVAKNTSSLAALAGIQQLDPEKYMEIYKRVYDDLSGKMPGSKYLDRLKQEIDSYSKLMSGTVAPDFTFPTPEGKPLALSSFKGKIVLVDFWASWCGPCRKENPNVVRMYNKYHKKGFEILGVSLDEDKERWVAAIKKDGLVWPHVSDLKGWQSEACRLYGIDAIPFTILLDKEGKIIAKSLRGAALEQKLEELFK
jgi:thiol-disulfide isomerase/thioredoxin